MTRQAPKTTDRDIVLLVDDNPTNLQVLFKTLTPAGYKILVAKSGKAAPDTAAKLRPELVLLDIMMPDMDGYEVRRRLKADAQTAAAAVIFCSARRGGHRLWHRLSDASGAHHCRTLASSWSSPLTAPSQWRWSARATTTRS